MSEDLRIDMHNSIFICHNLAEKMKDIKEVEGISLAQGFPGIAYFYSLMHRAFPYERWDQYAEKYVLFSLEKWKENKTLQCSLMEGLSGIGLAVNSLSNKSHFEKIQIKIDELLIEEVRRVFLCAVPALLDDRNYVPPNFYNLHQGLSGVIFYLLSRKDDPYLWEFAKECAEQLAKVLCSKKEIEGRTVPAWFIQRKWLETELHDLYSNGGFDVSMISGIAGVLTALVHSVQEGIRSDLIFQCLDEISAWIQQIYSPVLTTKYWNSIVCADGSIPQMSSMFDLMHHTWATGWISVLKGIRLAGGVLKKESLISFSNDMCKTLVQRADIMKSGATMLSIGMAGILAAGCDLSKNNPEFLETIKQFENEIIHAFDPHHLFGFQQCAMDHLGNPTWKDDPGFLHGAAGIGSALLVAQGKIDEVPFI